MPDHRDLFYDGKWQKPSGGYRDTMNPATGENLGACAEANAEDVDSAVQAAHRAFQKWREVKPLARAALVKQIAAVIRDHAAELAWLDSANCGSPLNGMIRDVKNVATRLEYYAAMSIGKHCWAQTVFASSTPEAFIF